MTTWREQLALDPALRAIDNWPPIALDALNAQQRREYFRRCAIVKAVLDGASTQSVATTFALSQARVYGLLRRTLASEPGQRPALRNGLVPDRRVRPYTRRKSLDDTSQGFSGAFARLQQQAPEIFSALDDQIRRSVLGQRHAEHVTHKSLHASLIRRLQDAGWPENRYPLTNASYAAESFRRWSVARHRHHLQQASQAQSSGAQGRHGVLSPAVAAPFREIQIDAWRIDAHFGLALKHDTGCVERIEISRFWLLVAVDSHTTAVVAYRYGFNAQVTQDDLLDLLEGLCQRWQPMTFTRPGLAYPPDAGLPSGLIDEAAYAAPTMICLDNAWAHQANRVRRFVVEQMGSIFNCGRPRQPTARRIVESFFNRLGVAVHRLPNTTGNSPTDPRRQPNAKHHSGREISVDECRELLEVVICAYNVATARDDLRGLSPLAQLRKACDAGYSIRKLGPAARREGAAFQATQRVTIHVSKSLGVKPWINFLYKRYRGDCLSRHAGALQVEVRYDTRDIRFLAVYTLDGHRIGPVEVQGQWRAFKHDARLRKQICRDTAAQSRQAADPIGQYLDQLLKSPPHPSRALEIHRLRDMMAAQGDDANDPQSAVTELPESSEDDTETATNKRVRRLQWRPMERDARGNEAEP